MLNKIKKLISLVEILIKNRKYNISLLWKTLIFIPYFDNLDKIKWCINIIQIIILITLNCIYFPTI